MFRERCTAGITALHRFVGVSASVYLLYSRGFGTLHWVTRRVCLVKILCRRVPQSSRVTICTFLSAKAIYSETLFTVYFMIHLGIAFFFLFPFLLKIFDVFVDVLTFLLVRYLDRARDWLWYCELAQIALVFSFYKVNNISVW